VKETVWAAVCLRSDTLDAEKTTPIEAVSLLDFQNDFVRDQECAFWSTLNEQSTQIRNGGYSIQGCC
jgi:hypothetical protein